MQFLGGGISKECLGRGFHIGSLQFVIGLPFSYANAHCSLRNLGINSYPSDFCEQQMLCSVVINIVFAFSSVSKPDDLREKKNELISLILLPNLYRPAGCTLEYWQWKWCKGVHREMCKGGLGEP